MNHQPLVELCRSAINLGETCVLCTVVRLDGSGYGRPGARLLVTETGERAGYISGGCLEKDLCRRVWTATESGPRLIAFDTRGNAVHNPSYNTGCEGIVFVLCQRITEENTLAIDLLDRSSGPSSGLESEMRLLTVYRSDSPAFHVGDMFVEFDGQHFSSANAGKLAEAGLKFLSSSVTNRSILFDDGLGFEVEAAVEIIQPPRDLLIFGAGDDAIPLVKMAADLGWHVRVVGRRPELANDARFKKLSDSGEITVYSGPYKLVVEQLSIGGRTDVVVMTHDFEGDVSLLPSLLESSARFIGLLGPKRRLGRIAQRLFESGRGLSDFDIARLRSPVGLDIGATSPDEIAVSIVAELLGNERGRDGGSLHRRQEPLHRRSPLIEIQSVISEPELAVQ